MTKFKLNESGIFPHKDMIEESDLEWIKEDNKYYRYHITLIHKPTEMRIEQASEASFSEAKGSCLKELHWRLAHWDEYQKSRISHEDN
jgi:hypothetical protein